MEYVAPSGVVWKAIGQEPYRRLDGKWTTLRVWEGKCLKCDKTFQTKTTLGTKPETSKAFEKKHCPTHRNKRKGRGADPYALLR